MEKAISTSELGQRGEAKAGGEVRIGGRDPKRYNCSWGLCQIYKKAGLEDKASTGGEQKWRAEG